MDEELGPITIEFVINNNLLKANAAQAEATLQGVTARVEAKADIAASAIQKLINKGGFSDSAAEVQAYADSLQGAGDTGRVALSGTDELVRALNTDLEAGVITADEFRTEVEAIAAAETYWAEQTANVNAETTVQAGLLQELKITLKELNAQKMTATAEADIRRLNLAIQETEAEIKRFANVGKVGFDEYGNKIQEVTVKQGLFAKAVERATSIQAIGARVVSQFTRQLIGMGVGFLSFTIGAKAFEKLVEYISNLDIFTGRLNQAKQNMAALTEVMKDADKVAGSQIGTLQLLYNEATNVNLSMEKRIEAAQRLREADAATFATSSNLAIVNGKLKTSYDELTKSIIENAKAQAAEKKIGDLEATVLDNQFDIDKNNVAKAKDIQRVTREYNAQVKALQEARKNGDRSSADITPANLKQQIDFINQSYNYQNLKSAQNIKIAEGQISSLSQYVGVVGKTTTQLDDANKLLGKNLENFDTLINNYGSETDLDNIKRALTAKLKAIVPSDAQFKDIQDKIRKVEELLKPYSPKTNDGKAAENADQEAIKRRQSLLQQIADVNASYRRKELTDDQASIQAILDKYDQLRAKIATFNADPKNKNHQIGQTTIDKITPVENAAIDNQTVLNENKYIAQDIETKKKLYADYEAYRAKVGSDAANIEYADLLKSGKDFQTYLDNVYASADKLQGDYSSDITGAAQERRDQVQKQIDQNREVQKKALQSLLEDTATYEEQRQAILETGADAERKLLNAGQTERAAQVKKNTTEELTALDEAQVKKLDSYKELFSGVYILTQAQTRRDIAAIQTYIDAALKAGKITKDAYDKINHELKNATTLADSDLPEKFREVGSALQQWGSELSYFDETLGHVLNTLGSVVSGIGSIKGNLNTLNDSGASSLSKISAGLGIVGTAIGVVTTVVGLFSNAKQKAAQEQYNLDLQIKAIEAVNKGLQRQLELTKQLYGPERVSGYLKALADIAAAQEKAQESLSGKLELTGNKGLDDQIARFNNGQSYNHYLLPTDLIDKLGKSSNLAGKSLEDLQKLLDDGKLDAGTQAIVQSLVDLQQQAIDTQNALQAEFTGSTFDDLVSGIKELLFNVNTTAQDWGNDFTKIIQNSIEKGFETQFIEKQMQAFYDDLAKYTQADGGILSKDSIAKLQAEYDKIKGDLQTELQQVQQATGITLSPIDTSGSAASNSPSAISGQISGITETQANALEGIGRGMQLSLVKSNELLETGVANQETMLAEMRKQTLLQTQIAANTKRTADNTDVLPTMRDSLTNIDKNTKDTSSNVLRAAGITG